MFLKIMLASLVTALFPLSSPLNVQHRRGEKAVKETSFDSDG
jgi:hypothetical protein